MFERIKQRIRKFRNKTHTMISSEIHEGGKYLIEVIEPMEIEQMKDFRDVLESKFNITAILINSKLKITKLKQKEDDKGN